MKKVFCVIALTAVLAGCSRSSLVNEPAVKDSATPIGFSVEKQNITKVASNLESVKHYNFGVWAWKVQGKNGLADQEVMNNYLVGWSNGTDKGYDKTNATTWAATPETTADHTSPWFYEKLGTAEYTYDGDAGFYKKTDSDYMSKNANQYLRYWDLAYTNTNFYCYAPYNKNVSFSHTQNGTSTMTFDATNTIRDGYDLPRNHAYDAYSRTLGEFMYAGVNATNENLADVIVPFKHMGAQLFIRFYEDIPGYKVEIIDLDDDHGTLETGITAGDGTKGIQAAPAVKDGTTYTKGYYYTRSGATIDFTEKNGSTPWAEGVPSFNWDDSEGIKVQTPVMFLIPSAATNYETYSVAPGNLNDFAGLNSTTHHVIREINTGGTQEYSYSPTIYYPVAQPQASDSQYQASGLTFHISYRVIAEDNKEVITVHNATVHVPVSGTVTGTDTNISSGTAPITAWNANVKYTYTFKFTRGTTGTTNPDTPIDPTDPQPSTEDALYPIVFDQATIEDYTLNYSEYTVSE